MVVALRRRAARLGRGLVVLGSLAGFIGFYTLLLIAEMYLMVRYARRGPSVLETGRYHFELQPREA